MKNLFKITSIILLPLSLNAYTLCPEGLKAEKRTVVVYTVNDKAGSAAAIHTHFKDMHNILRSNQLRIAAPLAKQKGSSFSYALYVAADKNRAAQLLKMDPNLSKDLFSYELQSWFECQ